MQLLNTAGLDLASSSGDLNDPSSPTTQSPTTSPPPSSTGKTTNNTSNSNQNGRHLQALPHTQQNCRNYLFSQQLLLHPAFRGLTARTQVPGVASGKQPFSREYCFVSLVSFKVQNASCKTIHFPVFNAAPAVMKTALFLSPQTADCLHYDAVFNFKILLRSMHEILAYDKPHIFWRHSK